MEAKKPLLTGPVASTQGVPLPTPGTLPHQFLGGLPVTVVEETWTWSSAEALTDRGARAFALEKPSCGGERCVAEPAPAAPRRLMPN